MLGPTNEKRRARKQIEDAKAAEIGLLVGWLVGCSVGWLVGGICLVGWLVG